MGSYSHLGAGHVVLRRLSQGTATFARLQALVCELPKHRPDKVKWLIRAMQADFLIDTSHEPYRITEDGRRALATLDRGEAAVIGGGPSVRVFVPRVAA